MFGEKRMEREAGWVERAISWKGVMVLTPFDLIVSEHDSLLDGDEKGGLTQKEGLPTKRYYHPDNRRQEPHPKGVGVHKRPELAIVLDPAAVVGMVIDDENEDGKLK